MLRLTIEYSVLQQFKPFLLGYCNCGCGENLKNLQNNQGKTVKYIKHHHVGKGDKCPNWKNGRRKLNGYWRLYLPTYYSSNKSGYVREHVYFFQEYNKCCMLKWGDVHHIDGNTDNNMPYNLQGMTHRQHMTLTHKKDMSSRNCFICLSNKTIWDKRGWFIWFKNDDNSWLCRKCYRRRSEKTLP